MDAAVASVDSLRAQLELSEATVLQQQSMLDQDRINLDYATIVSPIDGVVVSRTVDVGQTVAASFSTPTLFTIANDLTKVQIQASVPEADIGKLHERQAVRFRVFDAQCHVNYLHARPR